MATKKFFILGIQSLISSEDSTLRFGNDNTIIIPFPEGVDELHKLSINFNEKGRIAKKLLEYFSTFKIETLLSDDVVVQKNGSHLKFENSYRDVEVPKNLGKISNFEGRRIQIALGMKNDKKNAIIISKNPAFRMKLDSIQLQAQPFKDDIFPPLNEQYSARINCQMSEEKFDLFNSQGYITKKDIIRSNNIEWITNLFLNISSLTNSAHSILARYDGKNIVPLKFSDNHPFGISAKKAGQHMALEALLTNPEDAPIVIIKGSAGTGKTLLSLACGLNDTTYLREDGKSYSQIMITTPTETLRDENLGFLPGEFEVGHLDQHRQVLEEEHEAQQRNEQFLTYQNGENGYDAAQCQRAGVAHEHLCRERIVPQEAYQCPDKCCGKHHKLLRTGYVHDVQIAGVYHVTSEVSHDQQCHPDYGRGAGTEAVDAVGQVRAVGHGSNHHNNHQHEHQPA